MQLHKMFLHNVRIVINLTKKQKEKLWILELKFKFRNEGYTILISDIWENESIFKSKYISYIITKERFFNLFFNEIRKLSEITPSLSRVFSQKIVEAVELTISELYQFVINYPKYEEMGIIINIPDEMKNVSKKTISIKIHSANQDFSLQSLLQFELDVSIDGIPLTKEQIKMIIEQNDPLIQWNNQWILIDETEREKLRSLYFKKKRRSLTLSQAICLNLKSEKTDKGMPKVELDSSFKKFLAKLNSSKQLKTIKSPSTLRGELRPYQRIGYSWLCNMSEIKIGVILADDMGLGKTIQILACLLHRKEKYYNELGSILIVCPKSIIFNWRYEIQKFAPNLDIYTHYGPSRKTTKDFKYFFRIPHRIILTTYGTVRRDANFLHSIYFAGIILDEGQNIKNTNSQQTKAIYKLKGGFKIVLSGTPIENRLEDLWSLFHFLNPSLFGSKKTFIKEYIVPIEQDGDQKYAKQLKTIISPFILRRLKSDKSIIQDLPAKNEMKKYIPLTESQVNLYKTHVNDTLKKLHSQDNDFQRKGLVLQLIMHLKQICNHPFQALKVNTSSFENMKYFLSQSNKMQQLYEITKKVINNGEKVIIFTQFKQMAELIVRAFKKLFSEKVLFFHGGVSQANRNKIVNTFQTYTENSPRILVITLKSGGTGLNLTTGTTVIHYDSPWNPAAQDQATDRAYRIGQTQIVNVYKFITVGTIEEKIDIYLGKKRKLANSVITSYSKDWLSNLDYIHLHELFQLK